MKKLTPALFIALLIAACTQTSTQETPAAAASTAGPWKIDTRADRLTGKTTTSLTATLTNIKAASRQTGANIAVLGLSCDTAMIVFGGVIGGPGNSVVSFRIDDRPADNSTFQVRPSLDAVSAQGTKAAQFLAAAATGKTLYLRVSSLTMGLTELEVSLLGLGELAKSAGVACVR